MSKRTGSGILSLHDVQEYWAKLKPGNNIKADVEKLWKERVEFLDKVSMQNNVVVFLTNVFTGRYLYMSDKLNVLSGLKPALYMTEDGMQFAFSRFHPAQLEGLLKLNQFAFEYFESNRHHQQENTFVSLSFLLKNGNNEYVQVLQRGIVLEADENGKPSLTLSFLHYVGHIEKHNKLGCAITAGNDVKIYYYNNETRRVEPPKTFSDQERKILLLLAQGLDTKAIAKNLFISPHTVDNHRRNIIKKTNCIDTTGVVAFAQLINLI